MAEARSLGHHFGETVPAGPFAGGVGGQQMVAALAPGAASREELGEGLAEARGLVLADGEFKRGGGGPGAHEHLQQIARAQHGAIPIHHGKGRGGEGLHQLGVAP